MKLRIAPICLTALFVTLTTACEKPLEEDVYSLFTPTTFLNKESGIRSLLNATYKPIHSAVGDINYQYLASELTTDLLTEQGGGLEASAKFFMDYNWPTSEPRLYGMWTQFFSAIRDANVVIDNAPSATMTETNRALYIAEARFVRATAYSLLYDLWGPVPLVVSSKQETLENPRATEADLLKFVEDELRAAAEALPLSQAEYGRATKGAALGVLCKFLLNTKQWQKTADVADQIIKLGVYELFADRTGTLFLVENERNKEYLFAVPAIPIAGQGNVYLAHAAPPGYAFKFPPKEKFAANFKTPTAFYNTFLADDKRRLAFITEYKNTAGATVKLGANDVRSLKFNEDPASRDRWAGNDVPLVRYADVLLSRAEALNELSGPTQPALDLINQVRKPAGIPALVLTDFKSKEQLRDHLLAERGWEFFSEGKRRQDLIRHGRLISSARSRGKTVQDFQVRFPIPQQEKDANRAIVQNQGY